MLKRAVALLCLMAVPATAQDTPISRLIAAIEAAGCKVTASNGDAILAASGLSEAEVYDAVEELYRSDLALLEPDGSMTLQTDACK